MHGAYLNTGATLPLHYRANKTLQITTVTSSHG